jgi:lycopene beta-cyclase
LENNFDYIISGAGAAGMSLLMRMLDHPFLASKKILVIDKEEKNTNDHTWCFWEKEAGIFEPVIHHRWDAISFFNSTNEYKRSLAPYQYKMIRSKDLYAYVNGFAKNKPNVRFINTTVTAFSNHINSVSVITTSGTFTATHIFNSIILSPLQPVANKHLLLQHFKGWFIETAENVFDAGTATFMDFRVDQHDATTFVYVLPTAANKALVEYTVFSEKLLAPEQYDLGLKKYLSEVLRIENYKVNEVEHGVIPMTNIAFPAGEGNIHHIGTAGNWTKASTGFTFHFIQKNTQLIVDRLIRDQRIESSLFSGRRFDFYDATFLNVLAEEKYSGEKIFSTMFENNSIEEIFRFLDNESTLAEDIAIMKNLPIRIFAKAGWQELMN